ncbi:uncharacterized protein LOC116417597 [Nasonia vitripennis]|uniref:Ionotropic glutamate receptor L-glutamate and glycine-binding domain-containing protein n=1 Tax=Nasonia vitripennis TaxID=7425 RepID=A0A7M7QGL3_NASVI|nr:uncharacterized protein LOC116417597 [Nasonia vitripennis]
MKLTTVVLLVIISLVSANSGVEKTYTNLVKIVGDFRNAFRAFNIFIARSEPSGELPVSTAFVTMLKLFSKQNVFSMITTIRDISKNLAYYDKRMTTPYFVIIIRSVSDFNDFAKVTRQSNMNLYQMLMIFSENMKALCLRPEGNPFNLVLDSRFLIKCLGHPLIREWYSMYPNQTIINELLEWNSIDPGFKWLTNLTFYERRNSLNNMSLRVTMTENEKLTGFFGQILDEISKLANFHIDIQPYEISPGSYDPVTKKWSGVMGKLDEKKTDVGVGQFTVTQERLDIVHFSVPIIASKSTFYLKKSHTSHVLWSMYYKVAFGVKASYYLFIIFIISPILLSFSTTKRSKRSFGANAYENYFNVWGIFCAKSTAFPSHESARILYYSLCLLSFMLYAIYSALLVSYLTIFKQDMPFNSMEEFTDAKTHKIITIKNTSFMDLFKISHDTSMRELNSFLMEDKDLPTTLPAALNQICEANNLVLYIDEIVLRSNKINMACELIALTRGKLSSMALGLPKNSPYVGLINYQ